VEPPRRVQKGQALKFLKKGYRVKMVVIGKVSECAIRCSPAVPRSALHTRRHCR
jgi:hypothetical protein